MRTLAAKPKSSAADGNAAPMPLQSRHQSAGLALHIQRKLSVGATNDPLEQEADRVANKVMRMPDASLEGRAPLSPMAPSGIALAKPASSEGHGGRAAAPIVRDVLNSPGQPLDSAARAFFEPRFGRDFSTVRVHSGTRAAKAASAISARAFTAGRDIVLGSSEQSGTSSEARHLLAHELSHTVQQADQTIQRKTIESKDQDGQTTAAEAGGEVPKDVIEFLKLREGWRDDVYPDSLGLPTSGMGHLLTASEKKLYKIKDKVPLDVREEWAKIDAKKAYDAATSQAATLGISDAGFIKVLTSVNFQLGTSWNTKFKKTWDFMVAQEWEKAATEVEDSAWAKQTPVRLEDFQNALRALITPAAGNSTDSAKPAVMVPATSPP